MFCKHCGSQIDDDSVFCPRCGAVQTAPVQVQPVPVQQETTNVLAIVGFVLSFFVTIAGLICSIIGLKRAPQLGGKGRGLAIAGIIISAVSMALAFILLIVLFALYDSLPYNPFLYS